jgi:diaminopimelate epimerase
MKLAKWHGLGNDYLVVEEADLPLPLSTGSIVLLCDRHRGVGSDGVLLRCAPTAAVPDAVTRMRIFNPDGSESEMCGNGIRIFARYLEAIGAVPAGSEFTVETLAGPIRPQLLGDGMVRVDMGMARFASANIDVAALPAEMRQAVVDADLMALGEQVIFTFVDVGNPHCIIVVDDPSAVDLPTIGSAIERHPLFPKRTNVEFIRREADGSIRMRVGAAAVRLGLAASPVTVRLLGGDLVIEVAAEDPQGGADGWRVFKTGPAEQIMTCELSDELLRRLGWPAPAAD